MVLTHRSLGEVPANVEAFAGDVRELAASLRAELGTEGKDVWLMGGGLSLQTFLDAGLVDTLELYVVPELLGAGTPLFPTGGERSSWNLTSMRSLSNGMVEVIYSRRE